ncbi:MAG: adenylyltransferase/cytidyltransferase family protein [Candidatus Coproplasma sp.]
MEKKYKIGYTQGVYDMFHIGHLNLINQAKNYCEHLIVGVNSDSLVQQYKHHSTIINEEDRRAIVSNLKAVDIAIIVDTLNKVEILEQIKFNVIFIGDDWKGDLRWKQTEVDLKEFGVDVVYLPYTKGISSTDLRKKLT